jgi:hypothetical protein
MARINITPASKFISKTQIFIVFPQLPPRNLTCPLEIEFINAYPIIKKDDMINKGARYRQILKKRQDRPYQGMSEGETG